jgi:hypothetical protein
VCIENFIRIDLVTESLNVSADARAAMLIDAAGLGVQKRSATPREPCCGLILRSTFPRSVFVIALPTRFAPGSSMIIRSTRTYAAPIDRLCGRYRRSASEQSLRVATQHIWSASEKTLNFRTGMTMRQHMGKSQLAD